MTGRRKSLVPYARPLSAAAEGRRRRTSLAPRGFLSAAFVTSLVPSHIWWPPPQSSRDHFVRTLVGMMVGPSLLSRLSSRGAVPELEARRAAAALEAEAFAAASEYAAGATLASSAEQFEVFRAYCREANHRLIEFAESSTRAAALGGVQEPGESSATALPPATSEEYISDDSIACMLGEKLDTFTAAFQADSSEPPPKPATPQEIYAALDEIPGLEEDKMLAIYDILVANDRKFKSLMALPNRMKKKWVLKQIKS